MAGEGEFPKSAGDVAYASEANAKPNYVSLLEGINQNTILSENATVTDKTYSYADSDTMSDSTGYNNTIDTGNTTALYGFLAGNYYSGRIQGSTESDVKSIGNDGQTSSITINGTITNGGYFSGIRLHKSASGTATITVKRGAATIATITGLSGSSDTDISFVQGDYSELFQGGDNFQIIISCTSSTLYYNSAESYSGTNFSYSSQTISGGNGVSRTHFKYIPITIQDAVTQTNSKTFSSNVKSIFVNANKTLNGSSTITYDVSSDGGSVFEKTAQPLDTWVTLDGDNTDIVVKFNLNVDGADTPELYGYSYLVWS